MTSTQNSVFFTLPVDQQNDVFDFVLSKDGNLSSRLVCKNWLPAIDVVINKRWRELQAMPSLFHCTEHLFCLQDQCSNHLELFQALNREWKKRGVLLPKGELKITPSYYTRLSSCVIDQSLMKVWRRIQPQIAPFAHHIREPKTVRPWVGWSRTRKTRGWVWQANLSRLHIGFIPVEICSFPELRSIDLSHNYIVALPDFFGDFKELKFLNLEGNKIEELPEDFPNWTHLKEVNLNDNPLNAYGQAQMEKWKANKAESSSSGEF